MARRLKLDKRGDVSITLLVIGVFAICTLAILSFIFYTKANQGNFANTETFESLYLKVENFYFYLNSGLSAEESANKIGAQIEGNKLILNAQQEESRLFAPAKKILSVQYIIDLSK